MQCSVSDHVTETTIRRKIIAISNPCVRSSIDLIRAIIYDYVIHFRMAKALECPLAAVCTGVREKR